MYGGRIVRELDGKAGEISEGTIMRAALGEAPAAMARHMDTQKR